VCRSGLGGYESIKTPEFMLLVGLGVETSRGGMGFGGGCGWCWARLLSSVWDGVDRMVVGMVGGVRGWGGLFRCFRLAGSHGTSLFWVPPGLRIKKLRQAMSKLGHSLGRTGRVCAGKIPAVRLEAPLREVKGR